MTGTEQMEWYETHVFDTIQIIQLQHYHEPPVANTVMHNLSWADAVCNLAIMSFWVTEITVCRRRVYS